MIFATQNTCTAVQHCYRCMAATEAARFAYTADGTKRIKAGTFWAASVSGWVLRIAFLSLSQR